MSARPPAPPPLPPSAAPPAAGAAGAAPPRSLRDLVQGMVLGALLATIVLGVAYLALQRPTPAQVVVHAPPAAEAARGAGSTPLAPAATATAAPTPTPASVTVFVSGAVMRPGVYRLAGGARVQDALAAAGGVAAEAAPEGINLALLLRDEAVIHVPAQGEASTPPPATSAAGDASRGLSVGGLAVGPLINLNSAGVEELMTLPHIGPVKAQAIMAARPFASVEDLERVPGIGPATLEDLRPLVTAP